ncbi:MULTISPECIES: hypothetical protein [Streptomyces]|uniref:hypothetical protein n=1 Tax=Streptomyces TaxID=1883 RepID=UPI000B253EE9|nr:hypothetical protein [Streptomyces durhamensis]
MPRLPRVIPAALAGLELEGKLRRPMLRRIGPLETDLQLSLVGATVKGCATASPCPLSTW